MMKPKLIFQLVNSKERRQNRTLRTSALTKHIAKHERRFAMIDELEILRRLIAALELIKDDVQWSLEQKQSTGRIYLTIWPKP